MQSCKLTNYKRGRRVVKTLKNANHLLPPSAVQLINSLSDQLHGDLFSQQYLSKEFLSKLNDGTPEGAESRRLAAVQKWLAVEEVNRVFTDTFASRDPEWNILPRVTHEKFIVHTRRLIAQVLGELQDTIVLGAFSGGASTSRSRRESDKAFKFVGMADLTQSAYAYVDVIHREAPMLKQYSSFYELNVVEAAVLFTVPKNAVIDRCACKEPDINMFLQKGVGRHIRRRLLRFGVDLNDQSVNRLLAREGSLSGDLATIDLSSASDTINRVVVESLLPADWFAYLDDIRSHNVRVDGETRRTVMFSSMGNGFTFELESLLFWALMKSVSYFRGINGIVSVYGDDIIVPTVGYDYYTWVLKSFGFLPNLKKSFGSGPFRESCGGHYHLGEDVTPFYLRKPPTRLTDLIRVANQLRRWILNDPSRQYMIPGALTIWSRLKEHVPAKLWGGRDFASDTQLVTHNASRWRLLRVTQKKHVNELGRYLSWHCDNWRRSSESEIHVPSWGLTNTTQVCRERRSISADSWAEALWEEPLIPT